jgi:hypothetical protein
VREAQEWCVKGIKLPEEEGWYTIWESSGVYGRRCQDMDPSVGFVVAAELIHEWLVPVAYARLSVDLWCFGACVESVFWVLT